MPFFLFPLISYKLIHLNMQINPATMKPQNQYTIETYITSDKIQMTCTVHSKFSSTMSPLRGAAI